MIREIYNLLRGVDNRLPSSTATQLDKADTPVSSLAPASAALSNAVWTNTHAARVDTPVSNLASQASANALSGDVGVVAANMDIPLSSLPAAAIRSIQQISTDSFPYVQTITGGLEWYTYNNVEIAPVDTSKSVLIPRGWRGEEIATADPYACYYPRALFITAAQVSLGFYHYRNIQGQSMIGMYAQFFVVEFL